MTILVNTEINTEEEAHESVLNLYQLIVKDYIEITTTFLAFYNKSQIIIF